MFLVTSDVPSDNWSMTSKLTDRLPVRVYVHSSYDRDVITKKYSHKVDHKRKSGNITQSLLWKQNPGPLFVKQDLLKIDS